MRDSKIYANTYWSHKGRHNDLSEQLAKLVPTSGEVDNANENPSLELYRVACNCYYDLYNNGLCNRFAEFLEVFGFGGPYVERDDFEDDLYAAYHKDSWWTKENVQRVEKEMDRIIRKAAKEQGIKESA